MITMGEADPPHNDVLFYSAPFSRANRHFPVGNIVQWQVHQVARVKHFEDIITTITVPWFEGWDTVNLVKNTITGYVYWVTASSISTLSARSVSFELLFNAPTSVLAAGNTLTGVWDRLPTNECPYLKENAADSAMSLVSQVKLPVLYDDNANKGFCWFEIVVRTGSGGSEMLRRFGGFAYLPNQRGALTVPRMPAGTTSSEERLAYPSLYELMNNVSGLADSFSSDGVVTINVSARCPFAYGYNVVDGNRVYHLVNSTNTRITPSKFSVSFTYGDLTTYFGMYSIDTGMDSPYYVPNEDSLTVTCTPEQRKFGEFSLINGSGAIIANIPNEYFVGNTLTIPLYTRSDFTNIYTDLMINGSRIRIAEDKIPWTGNAWEEYQIRSMAYDRNTMDLAVSSAREQRNIDAVASLSGSAMAGAVGYAMAGSGAGALLTGATAIAGIVGAEMQGRLSERTAKAQQELKEKNVKAQLSNYFNVAQGITSLVDNTSGDGYRVIISMPAEVTSSYYTMYFEENGYKVQGKMSVTLASGVYKGRLTSIPINGVKGDLLNSEFIEGMKLSVIT